MKSVLNEGLREQLDLLRQIAPEKIVAMYQEIAIRSGGEVQLRPRSFNHMIDVIIEHNDAVTIEQWSAAVSSNRRAGPGETISER